MPGELLELAAPQLAEALVEALRVLVAHGVGRMTAAAKCGEVSDRCVERHPPPAALALDARACWPSDREAFGLDADQLGRHGGLRREHRSIRSRREEDSAEPSVPEPH